MMPEPEPVPASPSERTEQIESAAVRWQRWPCRRCGHEDRGLALVCPECDALPWDETTPLPRGPVAGSLIEVRSRGLVRNQFRFRTPAGFLGVLSRRLSGGGEWLGVDGAEWRIDRVGLLGFACILRAGNEAVAGAEAPGLLRGLFRGDFEVRQGRSVWRFVRTGLARHNFALVGDDDIEALRLSGGLFDPLRRVEVVEEIPLPALVLASYLSCSLRHGEGET